MIFKSKSQLVHKIRSNILLDIESDKHTMRIVDLISDMGIVNYLSQNGITRIIDLVKIDISKLHLMDDKMLLELNNKLNTLSNSLLASVDVYYNETESIGLKSIENIIDDIEERSRDIIIERYGLLGQKRRLDEIGERLSVSRQRVHQIVQREKKGITNKYLADDFVEVQSLLNLADMATPIYSIGSITKKYNTLGIIELIIETFPYLGVGIFQNKYIKADFLIREHNIETITQSISKIKKHLSDQKEFISLQEISQLFDINEEIIKSIKDIVVKDGAVAIRGNPNIAFGSFGMIYDAIKSAGEPISVDEISKKSGLTRNQVKSRFDRDDGKFFTNIGKSIYALTEWGFSKLQTNDLIYTYIRDSKEPKFINEIIRFVNMHKRINNSSIVAAISMDPRIVAVKPKLYSIVEWGATPYHNRLGRKYSVRCDVAILDILSKSEDDLTLSEIMNLLSQNFGDNVTSSTTTVYANLKKLKENGKMQFIPNPYRKYYTYRLAKK